MEFDVSLSNGRFDTVLVEGADDLVDFLNILRENTGDWVAVKVVHKPERGPSKVVRVLLRVSEIVSVTERN